MDNNVLVTEMDGALKKARATLPERLIKYEELTELAYSSRNIKQFCLMIKMTFIFHQSNPQSKSILFLLNKSVARSHYPYKEWLEAIEYFSLWLNKRNSKGCLKDIIQYISCIVEFNSNKLPQSLCILLEIMLDSHGFDKEIKPLSIHP